MAAYYVWSGATGSGDGSSWANAYTTLSVAFSSAASGDTFYVADDHSESTTGSVSLTFPGSGASQLSTPCKVLCVLRSGGSVPPVSADLRTTAQIAATGSSFHLLFNGCGYYYGVNFKNSATSGTIYLAGIASPYALIYFKDCSLQLLATGSGSYFRTNNANYVGAAIFFDNTTVTTNASPTYLFQNQCPLFWKNTSNPIQGTGNPTMLLNQNISSCSIIADGVDFSGVSFPLFDGNEFAYNFMRLNNCKIPSSGYFRNVTPYQNWNPTDFIVSANGSSTVNHERYAFGGSLVTELTVTRSGGASNGVSAFSWKIASTTYPTVYYPFECFQIAHWNSTLGSSVTATVEILNDGTTLTNADIWMEVEYLGTSGAPISSNISCGLTDPLASPTNLPTSSATWNTSGITTPVKQSLSVTFTPQLAGFVRATIKVAKPSKTIYVDPLITLS